MYNEPTFRFFDLTEPHIPGCDYKKAINVLHITLSNDGRIIAVSDIDGNEYPRHDIALQLGGYGIYFDEPKHR